MIMKKKTIRILVSVFVILLVFRLIFRTGDKLILSNQNKDGTYSIFIYEVGAPEFPFGEGRCEIVLKKGNITIENQEIIVYNDGKRLGKDNYNVNWLDDHANIIIHAEEMEDISLDLFYRQGE